MKGGKGLKHGHPASNRVPSGRPRRCGHQQSPSHLKTHACSLGQGCPPGGLELLWPCGHLRTTEGQYELQVCKGDERGLPSPTTVPPSHHSPGEGVCRHLGKEWVQGQPPPRNPGNWFRRESGDFSEVGGVQWLRFHDPNAGDPGFHPWSGN